MSATQTSPTETAAASNGDGRTVHVDPVHHVSYWFEREGKDLWVHTTLEPGAHLPEHFHPSLEENWEALDGAARVKLDGRWLDLSPADGPVLVGFNVKHELRNDGDVAVQMRTRVSPAGRLEEFLIESSHAARDGYFNARSLPTSLRAAGWVARFALRFRDETVMTSPPPALQRVLLPLVARIGRER